MGVIIKEIFCHYSSLECVNGGRKCSAQSSNETMQNCKTSHDLWQPSENCENRDKIYLKTESIQVASLTSSSPFYLLMWQWRHVIMAVKSWVHVVVGVMGTGGLWVSDLTFSRDISVIAQQTVPKLKKRKQKRMECSPISSLPNIEHKTSARHWWVT